jgi:beta-galactosidase/beta-glucuronidase
VLGWDPAEFDDVLLDAAQRHGIGVVLPFDLDPQADYTDPAVRQQLHDEVLAWVAQYRSHPALRMWGLGNEVLHKIVHPAWVGPQDPQHERNAEAFSDWLIQTADAVHMVDPDHPVTYRSAEDAFVPWVVAALQRRGGGPRPWFVWGTNCYQDYLSKIVDNWPDSDLPAALWVSEFAPGGMAVPDRPDGFQTMWGYIRGHPDYVLGGAVYAWTRNGPEGVDRNFGLTDDGEPVDGRSLDMLASLFHAS